ncbi:DNA-binding protein [Pseudomonas aeruginosa]|uniref:DNA-binding protein n=1 Tax=Pseudomonas aeruginosa TaxID=287 RepID=UPI0019696D05|nr:DNA-binding protein [Pseudomonas aeruginosa]
MATQKALTPDQVKQRFRQRGITITQWAAEHGYKRNAVYRVLNGFDKANYGQAHDIAVALDLKACDPVAA